MSKGDSPFELHARWFLARFRQVVDHFRSSPADLDSLTLQLDCLWPQILAALRWATAQKTGSAQARELVDHFMACTAAGDLRRLRRGAEELRRLGDAAVDFVRRSINNPNDAAFVYRFAGIAKTDAGLVELRARIEAGSREWQQALGEQRGPAVARIFELIALSTVCHDQRAAWFKRELIALRATIPHELLIDAQLFMTKVAIERRQLEIGLILASESRLLARRALDSVAELDSLELMGLAIRGFGESDSTGAAFEDHLERSSGSTGGLPMMFSVSSIDLYGDGESEVVAAIADFERDRNYFHSQEHWTGEAFASACISLCHARIGRVDLARDELRHAIRNSQANNCDFGSRLCQHHFDRLTAVAESGNDGQQEVRAESTKDQSVNVLRTDKPDPS